METKQEKSSELVEGKTGMKINVGYFESHSVYMKVQYSSGPPW